MFQRSFLGVIVLWALLYVACTMDDADRCPDGYFFMEDLWACCNSETHMPNEENDRCIPDSDDSGAGDGGDSSGIGEPCTSDADCSDYEANFCLVAVAVCTFEGCDSTGCPDGYTCCGPCDVSAGKTACVEDALVSTAVELGCPCEGQ